METLISIYNEVVSVWGLLGIFALAVFLSTLGAIAGLLTRNIMLLAALVAIIGAVVFFHDHLPLPAAVHHEIEAFKARFL